MRPDTVAVLPSLFVVVPPEKSQLAANSPFGYHTLILPTGPAGHDTREAVSFSALTEAGTLGVALILRGV